MPIVPPTVNHIAVAIQLLEVYPQEDFVSKAIRFIDDWALQANWQPARRALAVFPHLDSMAFVLQGRWDVEHPCSEAHPSLLAKLSERVVQQLPELYAAGKLRFWQIQ